MLSICAIFRNEARYIREWIEFHRLVRVDHFYLYNNNSTDDWKSQVSGDDITLIDWPVPNPSQSAAYTHCITQRRGNREWIAFIDCDEFLWSPSGHALKDVLEFVDSAIGVNWVCFGAGDETEYRPGLVLERFTWRRELTAPVNLHIKSIVWMDQTEISCGGTPHHFDTSGGTVTENGVRFHGPYSPCHSSNILRINHYSSKSRPEWEARCALGKPDRADINPDPQWWEQVQGKEVEDREIQRYLPALKARMNA